VFSPYYAAARRRNAPDPLDHNAFNIVLRGRSRRWCMTERPRRDLHADERLLQIGPSSMHWDGRELRCELRERGCPLPFAVRGSVRLTPLIQPAASYALDRAGQHWWTPIAPRARIEVSLHEPALRWSGEAYLDSNRGGGPLEADFSGWQWSRAHTERGTAVFYEPRHRRDPEWPLALEFVPAATPRSMALPARCPVPTSLWGIRAHARSDPPTECRLLERLVDAPFYSRSLLHTRLAGRPATTVHESLDLDRFRSRWVQWLLPFRMPRFAAGQRAEPSAAEDS
jgi:carotenoid 1,2-hydratase